MTVIMVVIMVIVVVVGVVGVNFLDSGRHLYAQEVIGLC